MATAKNTDRISHLPDDILSHILSYMPTICAIRTRVLSRRWKHLFSLVPVLDFFYHKRFDRHKLRSFLDFVNWVFNSYNVNQMDKFSYYGFHEDLPESLCVLSCISDSVCRGVQVLDVRYYSSMHHMILMPHGVFTCNRLTVLKICGDFNLEIPDDVYLPHIKKIHLSTVSFSDSVSAGRLFRSCPVLEDLSLDRCSMGDFPHVIIEISVPNLKSFCMHNCYSDEFDLVLDAPNVEHFECIGYEPHRFYALQDLKLLSKAYVNFRWFCKERTNALEKIVGAICHVRHIHLCALILEDFLVSGRPLPAFTNLIHLEIENYLKLRSVLDVLDKTPRLEVLVIYNSYSEPEPSHHHHILPEDVPTCVALHLKKVDFTMLSIGENQLKLVEYFLKNAKVLEKLKFRCIGDLEDFVEMNKKLLALPNCSSKVSHLVRQAIRTMYMYLV